MCFLPDSEVPIDSVASSKYQTWVSSSRMSSTQTYDRVKIHELPMETVRIHQISQKTGLFHRI
jgi:hypothetical protein